MKSSAKFPSDLEKFGRRQFGGIFCYFFGHRVKNPQPAYMDRPMCGHCDICGEWLYPFHPKRKKDAH